MITKIIDLTEEFQRRRDQTEAEVPEFEPFDEYRVTYDGDKYAVQRVYWNTKGDVSAIEEFKIPTGNTKEELQENMKEYVRSVGKPVIDIREFQDDQS